jgi:hypothetical protein
LVTEDVHRYAEFRAMSERLLARESGGEDASPMGTWDRNRFGRWSTTARVAVVVVLLATTTACTASSDGDSVHNSGTDGSLKGGSSAQTAHPNGPPLNAEAVEVLGTGGLLVAGRLPHGQRTQVWRCTALTDISECLSLGSPTLSRSDHVDGIAAFGRNTYWLLTMNPDRQRSSIHVTTNGGRSWVQHPTPSRGLAAGSWGAVRVFDERHALLIQYTASGPVVHQYLTDNAGASWQQLGEIALN